MDDPGWSWPAWKFGLRREDLFTTLHDKYNTTISSIQDPEAFHHDVYEISQSARDADEFHHLLADRKEKRLRELNEVLESASLEIIANPNLIGTQQWQYAVQLFRTKSFDSLVRYFASYLPDDHPWHQCQDDAQTASTVSSLSDSITTDDSHSIFTDSSEPFFDDDEAHLFTHEPLTIHTSISNASRLPPSPRSMTMCSDSSAVSPVDVEHHDYAHDPLTPARTLSLTEDESDVLVHSATQSHCDEYETSQVDEIDAPILSVSDMSEGSGAHWAPHHHHAQEEAITPAECEASVEDLAESGTPTPRGEVCTSSYISSKPILSTNPKGPCPSSSLLLNHILNDSLRASRKGRRDGSPARSVRRTSPEIGRIQKSSPDSIRTKPSGLRGRKQQGIC